MGLLNELPFELEYPQARRDESVVDNYHGTLIADPYRWLEDVHCDEVKEFIGAQRKLTEDVLRNCNLRGKFHDKITKLFDFPRYGSPFRKGKKYFYFHNTGLQAQSVLYVQDSLEEKGEVLVDPNLLSDDGTVALSIADVSESAEFLAVGLSSSGSDWLSIKVMRVADKAWESDLLSWVKFSTITWTHDNKGFFYSRYPAPSVERYEDIGTETNINLSHQLYYHILGTEQEKDILCWEDPKHPKWRFQSSITDDGKYLLVYIYEGCDPVNQLFYYDLSSLATGMLNLTCVNCPLKLEKLVTVMDAEYNLVANDRTIFTFHTNKNAPRYKVVRVDLNNPDVWSDVIPESESDVLQTVHCANENQLVVCYLRDVKYVLQVRDLESGVLLHSLPTDIGSIYNISGERKDKQFFFSYTSFLTPAIVYRCDLEPSIPSIEVFRESSVKYFDRTMFETQQVFLPSKDGTKIPMFIVSKKGIQMNGENPTLLYAYGGFNNSLTPFFSVPRIIFAHHCAGVIAFANIRGGGEYGEEWHKDGSLSKKENCFDDFISCAEFLIKKGYTRAGKLGIDGASNGGLLIASCVNRRPDLFGCAMPHVGVMDMLRFHHFTIGHAWTTEYGCSEKEDEFQWLIKYSPLHNVKRPWEDIGNEGVQYPAIMLLTADHDDRVVPHHSLKHLATLQYELCIRSKERKQTNPIIARIDTKAGHGCGRPTQKLIDEAADKFAFLAKSLNASWFP